MTDFQLKCVIATEKTNNFSQAAKVLYVSQATVSRQIDALEKELGFRLFERTTRNLNLTEEGSCFLEAAKRSLAALNAGISAAKEIAGREEEISIGCLRNIHANNALSKMMDRFSDRYPSIRISRVRGNEKDLITGMDLKQFDTVLITEHAYRRRLGENEILLGYLDVGVVIHRNNPLFYEENVSIEDIKQQEYFRYDPFGIPLVDDYLYNVCKNKSFTPNVVCQRDDFEEFLFDMEMGRGAAIMLEDQTLSASEMLRFVPLEEKIRVPLILVFPKEERSKSSQKLMGYIQNEKNCH